MTLLFIKKKSQYDNKSKFLTNEIKTNLNISKIKEINFYNGYDISAAKPSEEEKIIKNFLSENIDEVYKKVNNNNTSKFYFKYHEGQYDQRADSATECLKFLNLNPKIKIKTFSFVEISPKLPSADLNKIKNFMINSVDSEEFDPFVKTTINNSKVKIKNEFVKGFRKINKKNAGKFIKENSLSMSEDDLLLIVDYFKKEGRDAKLLEIKVLDTYWSDHCRHTTFNTILDFKDFLESDVNEKNNFRLYLKFNNENSLYDKPQNSFENNFDKLIIKKLLVDLDLENRDDLTLMKLSTNYTKHNKSMHKDLDISEEINACSFNIDVKERVTNLRGNKTFVRTSPYLLMFKNETHNHPTEIEPYGGAETCLGGCIRDPLSGRGFVYQAMRVSGSADPNEKFEDTLKNKLMQKTITKDALRGYSSYGNKIGIATGLVDEIYDEGFKAKRLELGAVVGAAPKSNVIRKVPKAGDIVILIGGRTGRDGIGGATGSSKKHNTETVELSGAEVQKGNPIVEKSILRLFAKKDFSKLIKRCNDFGAGGVSVAVGELADSIDIYLERIPKKYQGLNEIELALSESQERMAVVVDKKNVDTVVDFSRAENLEATVIAKVTNSKRLRMYYEKDEVLNISRNFIDTNGAKRRVKITPTFDSPFNKPKNSSVYKELNDSIKKGLIDNFDSTVLSNTVLMPLGGKNQITEQMGMVAKIPVDVFNKKDEVSETNTSSVLTYSFFRSEKNHALDVSKTIVSSVAKAILLGSSYDSIKLSFQEYYGRLNTDKKWGYLFTSLLIALRTQYMLGIPSIGGKDSMSGSYEDIDVPPTFVSFACGVSDAKKVVSAEFKKSDNNIFFVDISSFFDGVDFIFSNKSKQNLSKQTNVLRLKNIFNLIKVLLDKKLLSSISYSENNLKNLIIKNCLGNDIGFKTTDSKFDFEDKFGFVIEVDKRKAKQFSEIIKKFFEKIKTCEKSDNKQLSVNKKSASEEFEVNKKSIVKKIGILTKEKKAFNKNLSYHKKNLLKSLENIFPISYKKNKYDEASADLLKSFNKNLSSPIKKNVKFSNAVLGKKVKPKVLIPVFPGTNCEIDSAFKFKKAGGDVTTLNINNLTKKDLDISIKNAVEEINKSQIIFLPGGFSFADEPDGSAKGIVNFFKNDKVREATLNFYKKRGGLIIGICNGFQALVKLGLLPFGDIINNNEEEIVKKYLSNENALNFSNAKNIKQKTDAYFSAKNHKNNKSVGNNFGADFLMPTLTFNTIGRHISTIASFRLVNNISPLTKNVNFNIVYKNAISHGEGRFTANNIILKEMIRSGQIAFSYCDEFGSIKNTPEINPNGSSLNIEGITSKDGRILGKMGHSERIGENLYKNVEGNYDLKLFESAIKFFN